MAATHDTQAIRESSLRYQWMHNRDWTEMAEEGDPVVMVEGKGVRVTDSTGRTWLDAHGGYTSVHVGYGRDEISYAAYEQLKRVTFFPIGTTTEPVIRLCEKLAEITPGSLSRSYLASGGSEANETALKMVRAYHKRRGEHGRYKVISRKGSYHGTTFGTMWLGENATAFGLSDFEPSYPGVLHAPQPNPYRCERGGETPSECAVRCAEAVEELILMHGPDTVAAFIAEPVAQPPGAVVPGDEYWPMVRDICDRYGVVMIVDEIICGFGRTGKMFGIEHWGVEPDIMTVGKGIISSYLPLSATVVKKEIADHFGGQGNELMQAITASGHPVAAAAALKNIEIIEKEGMVQRSADTGAYLKGRLEGLMEDHPSVGDVRGLGLLTGVELVGDRETKESFPADLQVSSRLNAKFREHGLILQSDGLAITIGPPLCITRQEVDEIVTAVDASLGELESELGMG